MIRTLAAALLWALLLALPAAAQHASAGGEAGDGLRGTEPRPQIEELYPEFRDLAERAEAAIEGGRASTLAFTSLREDLAAARDRLMQANTNEARRATVQAQLEALGEAPSEPSDEDPRIAERRAALEEQLDRLRAPAQLTAESLARANGLIAEIDGLLRDRQARTLSDRGPLPVNPADWPDAAEAVGQATTALRLEAERGFGSETRLRAIGQVLPAVILFTLAGLLLIFRGRTWSKRLERGALRHDRTGGGAIAFIVSLGEIALPFMGLLSLYVALELTGAVGLRTEQVLQTIPAAGLYVLIARWLMDHFFPDAAEEPSGPLEVPPEAAARLRRLANAMGWVFAVHIVVAALIQIAESSPAGRAVLLFPIHVVEGLILFEFGRTLSANRFAAQDEEDPRGFRDGLVNVIGRLAMLAGIVGPIVAALGFDAASTYLLRPTALTLALVGSVMLLQRLVFDLYALATRRREGQTDALAPVLVAFALAVVALPILALIWGARVSDLTEIWARFRSGFVIGETTISPSDFLVFAAVFAGGYLGTRLLQGGLRNAVLPKTKLDIGGQNAIAAGIGYVGVISAAIIAITAAGVNLSALGYVAGALSVGIGFGLQNIVSNFVSGIILLIERPISQGDWIEVGGQMGYVKDISVRATRIETFDRTDVIVPNADFISGTVINWTRGNSVGRVIVPVGVAYGTDTQKVSDILLQIAREHPMVLMNPEPYVYFKGFGDSSLDFEIRAILRDINWVLAVQTEMNHAIAKRFAEEGIDIPFPQRDLWLRNPESLRAGPGAAPQAREAGTEGDWREALKGETPGVVKGEEG
ncbi:DUF3772 domain-containing protein [Histidinibacterium aquaticum]|uniref:Mechanosensitive ion channel family protein n=1 Tax=Histidinibacterium aquaticum TaxID=2613962 RepID=A0A5J5GN96_9RHOB|nr:DUF3772 domain-containing protein [Histidinibacterium aquaticum]KAA9009821.1 mechanosensitive ion channel family protein [Histidinibacterium aquaticum]